MKEQRRDNESQADSKARNSTFLLASELLVAECKSGVEESCGEMLRLASECEKTSKDCKNFQLLAKSTQNEIDRNHEIARSKAMELQLIAEQNKQMREREQEEAARHKEILREMRIQETNRRISEAAQSIKENFRIRSVTCTTTHSRSLLNGKISSSNTTCRD